MRKSYRYFLLTVLAVLVLPVVGTPSIKQTTATEHYDIAKIDGYTGDLRIVEPKNTTYGNVVPLSIVITSVAFEPSSVYYNCPTWGGGYSYSIDGQANVTIPVGTSPNMTLTNLASGEHCIIVYIYFYVAWGQLAPFCQGSEPVYFSVVNDVVETGPSNTLILSILGTAIIIIMGTILVSMYKKKAHTAKTVVK